MTFVEYGDFICTSKLCNELIPVVVKQLVNNQLTIVDANNPAAMLNNFTSIRIGIRTETVADQGLKIDSVEIITSSSTASGIPIEIAPYFYDISNSNFNQSGYLLGSEIIFDSTKPDFSQCSDSLYQIRFGEITRLKCKLNSEIPPDTTCEEANRIIAMVLQLYLIIKQLNQSY